MSFFWGNASKEQCDIAVVGNYAPIIKLRFFKNWFKRSHEIKEISKYHIMTTIAFQIIVINIFCTGK